MPGQPAYAGPLRGQPLAIELFNTCYAAQGERVDGLADQDSADAWLAAMAPLVPAAARTAGVSAADLRRLRAAVRELLEAALGGAAAPDAALRALNAASTAAPSAVVGDARSDGTVGLERVHPRAAPERVLVAAIAASALELAAEHRHALRACGAPGCVLMFRKDHPRREWCSAACGNRARQARHVARRGA